jgi:transposase InsO family protein
VTVERVMTDNGSCYKSFAFRDACKALGLRHIRTKPYTPKTNGKAERFINRPSAPMDPQLQLAPSPWRHKIAQTHQQTRTDRGQPLEAPQLERHSSGRGRPARARPRPRAPP